MYKPRDYQEKCHEDVMGHLNKKNPKPTLAVIPTGGGKSYSIAKLTNDFDEKTLILCPSQEILEQNFEKFISFGGEAGIYSASLGSKAVGKVTYATIGSVKNLGEMFKNFGVSLLVVDEAHIGTDPTKGMFKTFLNKLDPKYLVGYTASPFRLKTYSEPFSTSYSQLNILTRTRPKLFTDISHVTQISHLVENGYWAPVETFDFDIDPTGLILNSAGSDFTEGSIDYVNKNNDINNRIYKLIKNLISEGAPSILVFMDSVANCYTMAKALKGLAAVVDAKTKKGERKKIIQAFKKGDIRVVLCESTLLTGFDFPELSTVIMGRPTQSLTIFYQAYGRVVRPFKGKMGKFYDFGGNLKRFGRPEDLVIEDYNEYGWGVFTNNELFSGKPMGGPSVFKSDLDGMKKQEFRNSTKRLFEFGEHKNKRLEDIPIPYIKWAMANAKTNMSENLYNECKKIISTN